jgi:hypothetical protein
MNDQKELMYDIFIRKLEDDAPVVTLTIDPNRSVESQLHYAINDIQND